MTRMCSGPWLLPSSWLKAGASQRRRHLGAAQQGQQELQLASMGDVQPGKSASIQSSSSSFRSSSFSRLSLSGSRRQLSNCFSEACGYDKNERKGKSDEPGAPIAAGGGGAGEVDVVIGGEQRNVRNHKANASFKHSWRVDREATRPRLHRADGSAARIAVLNLWTVGEGADL